jgi:hypothetical protein
LWKRGEEKVKELVAQKEEAYVIWDESELEKSESMKAEGTVCGAFNESSASETDQTRLHQPTHRPTHLCAGRQLVTGIGHGDERLPCSGTPVLVDKQR